MNVSLSLKELVTKQYRFTARERLMVIVAIGVIVFGITIYISTSEVAVEPGLPTDNPQKTVITGSKQVIPTGKQVALVSVPEQPMRNPFAKVPDAKQQKNEKDLAVPIIQNNVPGTPPPIPGMIPSSITPSGVPQKDFILTGIVSDAERGLAVIASGGKSKAYAINDMVGNYQVAAINAESVVLTNADDRVVLHFQSSGQKGGKI